MCSSKAKDVVQIELLHDELRKYTYVSNSNSDVQKRVFVLC